MNASSSSSYALRLMCDHGFKVKRYAHKIFKKNEMPKVETEERMGSSAPVEIDGIQISELQMRKKSHKHDLFTIDLHRSAKSTERMDGE